MGARKKEFLKRKREKATDKHRFYDFVARKIRDIMKAFPCGRLVMDAQGGGDPGVAEALEDPDGLLPGEEPIYPVIDPEDRKDTDGLQGLHILELVQFADAAWTSEANHGLKRDLEQHRVLFPHLDSAQLGLAVEQAKKDGQLYDTLDDAAVEVEELKRELATIVHSQTDGGRERWDVPKIKGQEHGKGRLRKDRYSALLMANAAARREALARRPAETQAAGGWATDLAREGFQDDSPMYVLGQGWVEMDAGWSAAGKAVRRGGVRR